MLVAIELAAGTGLRYEHRALADCFLRDGAVTLGLRTYSAIARLHKVFLGTARMVLES